MRAFRRHPHHSHACPDRRRDLLRGDEHLPGGILRKAARGRIHQHIPALAGRRDGHVGFPPENLRRGRVHPHVRRPVHLLRQRVGPGGGGTLCGPGPRGGQPPHFRDPGPVCPGRPLPRRRRPVRQADPGAAGGGSPGRQHLHRRRHAEVSEKRRPHHACRRCGRHGP